MENTLEPQENLPQEESKFQDTPPGSPLESPEANSNQEIGASARASEIVLIPLTDLTVPSWNPRKSFDEAEMQTLMTYLKTGGLLPPIEVWKGNGNAPWPVISGQRRLEAFRRLGKTHIEVQIRDISLKQAKVLAIASNRDDKPYWLDEYTAVESLLLEPGLSQKELAESLGWSTAWVSHAVTLTDVLNPASRRLIEQIAQAKIKPFNFSEEEKDLPTDQAVPWQLTEKVAYRLTRLLKGREKEAAQSLAEKALPLMIAGQYTGPQTDELVAWLISGKDLSQFNVSAKRQRGKPAKADPVLREEKTSTPELTPETNPSPKPAAHRKSPAPKPQVPLAEAAAPDKNLGNGGLEKNPAGPQEGPGSIPPKEAGPMGSAETLAWDLLAGVSVLKQIRQKVKAGHRPTFWEALALMVLFLGETALSIWEHLLKPGLKMVGGVMKKAFHLGLKGAKNSLKKLLKLCGKTVSTLAGIAASILFIAFLGWLAYDTIVHHGFRPLAVLEEFWDFLVMAAKMLLNMG